MDASRIRSLYEESFQFLQERKRRQVSQLVLLNNLQRGDENIASTLLITLFNRTLSALYDNQLQIKFLPSQGILQEQISAYNLLAQSDYLEMGKSKLDYDWCWDALFFGRGYVETLRFNKKRKIMEPCVINPLMFGYDPYFEEVQSWRYYWKWVTKSRYELEALIKAGIITGISRVEEIPSGIDPYIYEYKIRRDQASKAIEPPVDTQLGDVFQILEFFGYNDKGEKTVSWIDKSFSKVLMEEVLDLEDGEEVTALDGQTVSMGSRWPIVIKEAFRIPHSSVTFSVADLLEDKHRAKSVLLNLAYIAAKDRANPIYGYNPEKIKDVTQFFSRQINQHIPMDDESAAWPLNTEDPMSTGLINFITMLQQEATDPVGVGISVQPETGSGNETATEAAIDQQLNDMAQSLQSKVLQFGESDFWSHWFSRYAKHGKSVGEKMANTVGVKGVTTEVIDLGKFNVDFPPGVFVYSAKEAQYKELIARRDLMTIFPNLVQTMDSDGMRNFQKHVFFPKFLDDPSLIDIMFPKTLDEMKAADENESLKKDILPVASETDDHSTHIYMHHMVTPKTWATWFHIEEHEKLLAEQKRQERIAAQVSATPQPKVGATTSSPRSATAPLKDAIQQTVASGKTNLK